MRSLQAFNSVEDRLLNPKIRFLAKTWPAFRFWNGLGIVAGMLLAMGMAWQLGLSAWVLAGLTMAGVAIILGLALAIKVVTGVETLANNYHTQMLVIGASGILLWLLRQPILPYLDLIALGFGLTIVLGRIACLMAGCCHGRPASWGVRYGPEHVADGFPACLAGVRLLPVQAIESAWALGMVIVGTVLALTRSGSPGTVLAWHVVAYGVGRFSFEFWRGDTDRPYWRGFSEAQWTALVMVTAVAVAGWVGVLPFYVWQAGAAGGLLLVMVAAFTRRRADPARLHVLLHPRHIKEVAEALRILDAPAAAQVIAEGRLPPGSRLHLVPIECTSQGIQISLGDAVQEGRRIRHYTLSRRGEALGDRAARALAGLIVQLARPAGPSEIIPGKQAGIFHVLIYPDSLMTSIDEPVARTANRV